MSASSDPNPERSEMPTVDMAEYQLSTSKAEKASVFPNANNVRIKNFTANINPPSTPTLDVLYQRVSPSAIRNEGGRADDAKCYLGTREEVLRLLERWMDAAEFKKDRIFWLLGPAGGGKTAIMKTITERSADRGIHTINFFFFRGDSTRNSLQPVVPTLLYQLFEHYPESLEVVTKLCSARPRILDTTITEQCKLISALFPIIRQSVPPHNEVVLLVDGLDECDVDAERSQGGILRALDGLVTAPHSPFRLLIASRPEAHIQMAFNQLPSQTPIFFEVLDDAYWPEKDIRRFVISEFDKIKATHPSARQLPHDWPSPSDVEKIVKKSSGQFIYASTAMRYVATPSIVPSLSLERVMGITPSSNTSPFVHLDSFYTFVLSRAHDQTAMRELLAMDTLLRLTGDLLTRTLSLPWILQHYDSRYTSALVQSCISELSSIMRLDDDHLRYYHASLYDFLLDKDRSGVYWIDVDSFREKVLIALWDEIFLPGASNMQLTMLREMPKPSAIVTRKLLTPPFPEWSLGKRWMTEFLETIGAQYYENDVKTYKRIVRRYIYMCLDDYRPRLAANVVDLPYVKKYITSYGLWKWWFNLCNTTHK